MSERPSCTFAPDGIGAAVLAQLDRVLDPELDEPILDLGFVRSLELRAGHAIVALQLPTSWCAVNFAYIMAEDVRRAVLAASGIERVTVRLGDHCAAAAIESAVNGGKSFAEAFPGEGGGELATLRRTFLRKGFFSRQVRLLQHLRSAGWADEAICAARLDAVAIEDEGFVIAQPGGGQAVRGPADLLCRYLDRRAELGLDCRPAAPLFIDAEGDGLSAQRLAAYYRDARTVRLAMEANGAFCRAMLTVRRGEAGDRANA